jgi:hypothetical protein
VGTGLEEREEVGSFQISFGSVMSID